MVYKVTFWGGPRDGEKLTVTHMPQAEVLCADAVTEVDPAEFYAELANNPLRTRKYHHYVLKTKESKTKKDDEYIYKFCGMI